VAGSDAGWLAARCSSWWSAPARTRGGR